MQKVPPVVNVFIKNAGNKKEQPILSCAKPDLTGLFSRTKRWPKPGKLFQQRISGQLLNKRPFQGRFFGWTKNGPIVNELVNRHLIMLSAAAITNGIENEYKYYRQQ